MRERISTHLTGPGACTSSSKRKGQPVLQDTLAYVMAQRGGARHIVGAGELGS